MTKEKRIRILTNREYPNRRDWSGIEIDVNGVFFWVGEEFHPQEDTSVYFSFPCGLDFVAIQFHENGRRLDTKKLPSNFVVNPYRCNL